MTKRGRPEKPRSERLVERVETKLTDLDHALFVAKCDEADQPVAERLRMLVREDVGTHTER